MDETLQNLIASLTNEENTEIIEQLITGIQSIPPVIQEPVPDENAVNWEEKYSALQKKYVERFTTGGEPENKEPENKEPENEEGSEEVEDLFK